LAFVAAVYDRRTALIERRYSKLSHCPWMSFARGSFGGWAVFPPGVLFTSDVDKLAADVRRPSRGEFAACGLERT